MALLRAPATSWALVPQAAASPLARPTPGSTLSPSAPTRGARPGAPRAAWRWGQAGPASPVGRNDLAWGKRVVPGFLQQKMVTELSPAGRPPLPLAPRWAGKWPFRSAAEPASREFAQMLSFYLTCRGVMGKGTLAQMHLEGLDSVAMPGGTFSVTESQGRENFQPLPLIS